MDTTATLSAPTPVVLATPTADVDVQDFSIEYKPIRFKVNGPDVYEAHPLLPVPSLRQLARMHKGMEQLDADEKFDRVLDMFDLLLKPDSATRFRVRVEDVDDPVDMTRQVMPVLHWLLEKFGMRPTQPAGSSATGPSSTGTTSTAGAPPEALTLNGSVPTGS